MNKTVCGLLIVCSVANLAVHCEEWKTTGWFARADGVDQRKAYIEEVVDPVLRNEKKELEKDITWANKQADNWKKSYYTKADLGQSTSYAGDQINFYRNFARQAAQDKQELENSGKEIILGWMEVKLNREARLRNKAIEAADEFRKKYDITPEQEAVIVLGERKPSGAFFSPMEEEKPFFWQKFTNRFK